MFNILAVAFAAILYGAPPTPVPAPTPTIPPLPRAGGTAWTPAQIAALQRSVAVLLNSPTLHNAQIGLYAIDTMRHTQVFSRNSDEDFMPASNFKLLVGSVALARLGTSFSYTTKAGMANGNVYLRGGGDSHLSAADLNDAAAAIAARGITHIDGNVITDSSHFDDQRYGYGWSWDDLPYYYAPVVTALELEDGVLHMTFIPGALAGAPVDLRVWPQSSAYEIDNTMVTGPAGSKDTTDFARPWDRPRVIQTTGSYPLGSKESGDAVPSVPDPESYAGDVFLRALRGHGIGVSGNVQHGVMPQNATIVWTHASPSMPELLKQFWYPSDNLMGELFLKELGVLQGGEPGSDDKGRTLEQTFLRSIGVNLWTVTIGDGSGLSQYSRITPRDFIAILQYDWNSPNRDIVLDALPNSGTHGILGRAYLNTPAQNMVFAKTGSINHVRTLSGYVQTKTHGPVTFSFLINQWMGEDTATGPADLAKVRAAVLSQFASQ